MRTNITTLLFCSKHPKTQLEVEYDTIITGASSAYNVETHLRVKPCMECTWEYNQLKSSIEVVLRETAKTADLSDSDPDMVSTVAKNRTNRRRST